MKAHNKIGGSKRLYREPRPRFISPHHYVMSIVIATAWVVCTAHTKTN